MSQNPAFAPTQGGRGLNMELSMNCLSKQICRNFDVTPYCYCRGLLCGCNCQHWLKSTFYYLHWYNRDLEPPIRHHRRCKGGWNNATNRVQKLQLLERLWGTWTTYYQVHTNITQLLTPNIGTTGSKTINKLKQNKDIKHLGYTNSCYIQELYHPQRVVPT